MQSKNLTIHDGLSGEWHYRQGKGRLIVLCHGYQSSQKDPTIVAIAKGLNNDGRDTFTFNFSENVGNFDIRHQVEDIADIAEYFKQYSEIVLLGGSFGALTAAIATLKVKKVQRLITLNGFFGEAALGPPFRDKFRKFRIASFVHPTYRRIWKYYRQALQPEAIAVPVLVIYSKVDALVFHEQSQHFYDRLTASKQFVELEHATHGVSSDSDRQVVLDHILSWLKQ